MAIVNFINSWLKDIVVLFILISIAELVMPKGNMKKYIDLIIGFLIIFTIITPFAKLVKKDFNFDEAVFNYLKQDDFIDVEEIEFHLEQDRQIEGLYKEKIREQITKLIEEESKCKVVELSMDISNSEESYGEIQHLHIMLTESKGDIKDNKISIEKIKPVDINKRLEKVPDEDSIDYKRLKLLVSTEYSISKDKITIVKYEKRNGEEYEGNIGKD